MVCSYKWTASCLFIILSCQNGVLSYNNLGGGQKIPNQSQCSTKERNINNDASTKTQLMNTLFNIVAANGGLPDLLSAIQPSLSNEVPQCHGQTVKDAPKSLNIIQLSSNPCQQPKEQIVVTGKPVISVSQPILAAPLPIVSSQPTCITTQYNYVPSLQQPMYQVNNPKNYPNIGMVQPIPAIWHPQPVVAEKSMEFPVKLHSCSPNTVTQDDNYTSSEEESPAGISKNSIDIPSGMFDNPSPPFNLQINIPAQSLPEPKITVVSTLPPNQPSIPSSEVNRIPYLPPFYPPPIIVESSESLNSLLPLILVALIAKDRGCGGGCGCTCCCPCSSSGKTIPIPFPIPIPVNSPIINQSRSSSKVPTKKPQSNDDSDEDDDDDDGGDDDDDDDDDDTDASDDNNQSDDNQ